MERPLILVSPHTETEGTEFPDAAISLSFRYSDAVIGSGGLPMVLPCTTDRDTIAEAISHAGGVLLSGGEDVTPSRYGGVFESEVHKTVVEAVAGRDAFELALIEETLSQGKPVLAICRGIQILNVALGGTLLGDIRLQHPGALDHNRQDERFQPVHDVQVEPGSSLATLSGVQPLRVNSTHHQAIARVAACLRVVARSPDGIIEGLEWGDPGSCPVPFLIAVQYHPERLWDRHPPHHRLFQAFIAACRKRSRLAAPVQA
ncbi:MAG: gamma-glutamyl-gamma-aminobutyrate hydrolase family protein [Verrucomicrobiales bacterium]|nr:gamma-glutamyl-gamma-aminobutyrate hydrolase family protein [Verrucomicrobiales bacterium]